MSTSESELLRYDEGRESWRYTGPLPQAQRAAHFDREVLEGVVTIEDSDFYVVLLGDQMPTSLTDFSAVAEWGSCALHLGLSTEEAAEQAWRYAIGAYLGPVDEEYQGDEWLANWLRIELPHVPDEGAGRAETPREGGDEG